MFKGLDVYIQMDFRVGLSLGLEVRRALSGLENFAPGAAFRPDRAVFFWALALLISPPRALKPAKPMNA